MRPYTIPTPPPRARRYAMPEPLRSVPELSPAPQEERMAIMPEPLPVRMARPVDSGERIAMPEPLPARTRPVDGSISRTARPVDVGDLESMAAPQTWRVDVGEVQRRIPRMGAVETLSEALVGYRPRGDEQTITPGALRARLARHYFRHLRHRG